MDKKNQISREEIYEMMHGPYDPRPDYDLHMSEWGKFKSDRVQRWIVDGLIPWGTVAILASAPKIGKTVLSANIARAIIEGKDFAGRKVEQGSVLWFNNEDSAYARRQCLKGWRPRKTNRFKLYQGSGGYGNQYLDNPFFMQAVHHWANKVGPKLIIFDCLHAFLNRRNIKDHHTARNVIDELRMLAGRTLTTILIIHHLAKNDKSGLVRKRLSDSVQVAASVSTELLLDCELQSDGTRIFTLACSGRGMISKVVRLWSKGVNHFEPYQSKLNTRKLTAHKVIQKSGPLSVSELAQRMKIKETTARDYLSQLSKDGLVQVAGKVGRKFKYASTKL